MFGEAANFGEEPSRVQGWGSTEYTSWKKPGRTTHDFCVYLVNAILLIHPSPPPFPLQNHEFVVCICESVLYADTFLLLFVSTCEWYHVVFILSGFFT